MEPKKRMFLAIDGRDFEHEHRTVFCALGCSDGSQITNAKGLNATQCLDYLLTLRIKYSGAVFVSYCFARDVNGMLAGSLSTKAALRLASEGFVYLQDKRFADHWLYVEYQPKKHFTVSRRVYEDGRYRTLNSIKVYDVFGFFGCTFTSALETFDIGAPCVVKMLASKEDHTPDLTVSTAYMHVEMGLLAQLVTSLDERLQLLGIRLPAWHGAGAIAGALFRRHKVKEHLYTPAGERHELAVMSAYHGGRTQCLQVGKITPCYGYDIHSAYPSVLAGLPSLAGTTERRVSAIIPGYRFAIYRVKWKVHETSIGPLPFRNENGTIEYPQSGEGFYWYAEVQAVIDIYGAESIEVISGYVFDVQNVESRPFAFVRDLYQLRKSLQEAGNRSELCIKMALNSMYGKFAQSIGWRDTAPPYQCFIYAGIITSEIRARMLRAANTAPNAVVTFATDGLLSDAPLDVSTGDDLGEWDYCEHDGALVIKPGVHRLFKGNKCKTATRGFPPTRVVWKDLEMEWYREGPAGAFKTTYRQFVGMKTMSPVHAWGQWTTETHKVDFWPGKGYPVPCEDNWWKFRIVSERFKSGVSKPYVPPTDAERAEFEYLEYFDG